MNLGEIIRRVRRQFGDESGAQITRQDIVDWANDGQMDIVKKTDALQQRASTNVVADDGSYTVPDDILQVSKVSYNGAKIVGVTLAELDKSYPDRTDLRGVPTHYYVWGQNLWLFPEPDTAGTGNLDIFYTRTPVALVNDSDVPEIPAHMHEDIVRFCLGRAKELDDTLDEAAAIMNDYEIRVNESKALSHAAAAESYPAVRLMPGDD